MESSQREKIIMAMNRVDRLIEHVIEIHCFASQDTSSLRSDCATIRDAALKNTEKFLFGEYMTKLEIMYDALGSYHFDLELQESGHELSQYEQESFAEHMVKRLTDVEAQGYLDDAYEITTHGMSESLTTENLSWIKRKLLNDVLDVDNHLRECRQCGVAFTGDGEHACELE